MLNTFFHRARAPWTFATNDNHITIMFRVGKNWLHNAKIRYGDALGLFIKNKWYFEEKPMIKIGETHLHEFWSVNINFFSKRYRYAFELTTSDGEKIYVGEKGQMPSLESTNKEGVGFTFSYWNIADTLQAPAWSKSINWYQIFPDRFLNSHLNKNDLQKWEQIIPNGHEILNGTIKGITEKLSYIKSLGFSGIYLTPIMDSPTSHKYDTTDYYQIDSKLGSEEDLIELIDEAKKLNIKIMLDGVFNHIGASSLIWQDVIKNKHKSQYKDWFWINDFNNLKQPEEYNYVEFAENYPYETFSFAPAMPRLNWNNHDLRKYIFKAVEKWTKLGIDGWRLDVSFEPSLSFWREFKQKTQAINPEILIIGEVWWDSIKFLQGDMWHGVMNYPLRNLILEYVNSAKTTKDKNDFIFNFNKINYMYTPEQNWGMFNLLDSHDTERIFNVFNGNQSKIQFALELLFVLPGATSTYYGTEILLPGGQDPDNRRPMKWDDKAPQLKSFMNKIIARREKLVHNSSIYEWFSASLENDQIVIKNGDNKIILQEHSVQLERIDNANN